MTSINKAHAVRFLKASLGFIVGGAFIYAIANRIDVETATSALTTAAPGWLIAAVTCLIFSFVIRTFRWWLMLRAAGSKVSLIRCFGPFFTSFGMNNVLPLRAGDVMRAFAFTHEIGCRPTKVLGTMVVERVLDLFVLCAIWLAVVLMFPSTRMPTEMVLAFKGVTLLAILMILFVLIVPKPIVRLIQGQRCSQFTTRFPWGERVRNQMLRVLNAMIASQQGHLFPKLVLLSFAAWGCESLVFLCVAESLQFQGDSAGPFLAFSTSYLATLLPGPPGNFGTLDFFAMQGFVAAGVTPNLAAAMAVLAHLVIWAPITIIAFGYLIAGPTLRRKALQRQQDETV